MAYAIIETGGKQLRVEPGRFYDVERLPVEAEGSVTIDRVLFIENDGEVSVGQPLVEGASIEARVLRHYRGRKVIVYKMKPKKKTRKKRGHRQEITRILINSITFNGESIGAAAESTSIDAAVEAETELASIDAVETATADV